MSEYLIQDTTLKNIANALREKKGSTDLILVTNLAEEIKNLPSGSTDFAKQVIDRSITEIKAEDLEGCEKIGGYAFYQCEKLTNVVLADSVKELGSYVFTYSHNLKSINLGKVEKIGSFAVGNIYYGLTSITIPETVKNIGNYALYGNKLMKTVILKPTTPPTLGGTSVFSTNNITEIIVPKGTLSAYKSATNWSAYASKIVEAKE
jgi:hypothetical protein